jgi:hypothetical protein
MRLFEEAILDEKPVLVLMPTSDHQLSRRKIRDRKLPDKTVLVVKIQQKSLTDLAGFRHFDPKSWAPSVGFYPLEFVISLDYLIRNIACNALI